MFDKFADYMQYLMTTPLKGKNNQFYLFFKVVGKLFDESKEDIIRFREETLIETASPIMLEVHGQERDMVRLQGESVEGFRRRLQLKTMIAELSGSEAGILLALQGVGYSNCTIEPVFKTDPDRWAEIYVDIYDNIDSHNSVDFQSVKREVMKTKQASTYPNFRFKYPTTIAEKETISGRMTNRIHMPFFDGIFYLNGSFYLNDKVLLDAEMVLLETKVRNRIENPSEEEMEVSFTLNNNLWYLDGAFTLESNKKMDAYTMQEVLADE